MRILIHIDKTTYIGCLVLGMSISILFRISSRNVGTMKEIWNFTQSICCMGYLLYEWI